MSKKAVIWGSTIIIFLLMICGVLLYLHGYNEAAVASVTTAVGAAAVAGRKAAQDKADDALQRAIDSQVKTEQVMKEMDEVDGKVKAMTTEEKVDRLKELHD